MYIFVCHSHKLANGSVRLRQVSRQDYRSWHRHVRLFCQLKSQQSSPSQHLHTLQLLCARMGLCVHSLSPKFSVYTYCVSRPISIKTLSFCSSAICWVMAPIVLLNPWCLTNPAHYCWTKDQHGTDIMLKTPPLNTLINDLEDSYSGKFIKTLYSLF